MLRWLQGQPAYGELLCMAAALQWWSRFAASTGSSSLRHFFALLAHHSLTASRNQVRTEKLRPSITTTRTRQQINSPPVNSSKSGWLHHACHVRPQDKSPRSPIMISTKLVSTGPTGRSNCSACICLCWCISSTFVGSSGHNDGLVIWSFRILHQSSSLQGISLPSLFRLDADVVDLLLDTSINTDSRVVWSRFVVGCAYIGQARAWRSDEESVQALGQRQKLVSILSPRQPGSWEYAGLATYFACVRSYIGIWAQVVRELLGDY